MEVRHGFAKLIALLASGAAAMVLGACGASPGGIPAPPLAGVPGLPQDTPGRFAAATHSATIDGAAALSKSPGASINGNALDLPSPSGSMEWGIWRYVPDAAQSEVVSAAHIGISVASGGNGWIAIADYARGVWEFRGPYAAGGGGESKDFINLDAGGYLSPAGNLYFMVLAFDGTSASLPSIGITSDVTPPPPTYTVSGSAVNSADSSPLPGVTVHLNPGARTTTTAADGSFSFTNLDAGSYSLTADQLTGFDPFTPASIPVTVGPDSTGNVFTAAPSGPAAITYESGAGVIKALMNANCVSCHSAAGGETPLTTWSQVNSKRVAIAAFVADLKSMPPTGMTQGDRDKFAQWRADGYQQ